MAFLILEKNISNILPKQQWDNELLRHLSWDALHPWGLEEWKDSAINKGEDDRFLFAILEIRQRNLLVGFRCLMYS